MSKEKRQQIASQGGRTAHANHTAHVFTHEEAQVAGKKGGQAPKKKTPKIELLAVEISPQTED